MTEIKNASIAIIISQFVLPRRKYSSLVAGDRAFLFLNWNSIGPSIIAGANGFNFFFRGNNWDQWSVIRFTLNDILERIFLAVKHFYFKTALIVLSSADKMDEEQKVEVGDHELLN
jgi:hypothetical protein